MNRAGHVTSGLAAGVAAVPLLDGDPTVSSVLLGGMATAASALLPDLDHPNSTASRHFGPVTRVISKGLRGLSATVYRLTKGPRDEQVNGKHRHLSHTFLFAGLVGWGVTTGCRAAAEYHPAAGVAAVLTVVALLTSLATTYFGRWALAAPTGLVLAVLATGHPVAEVNGLATHVGWYVAIGCAVHCLGDALTEHGCPFLYPLPIKGETFYEIRPPALLRFRTGGPVESVLVVAFTASAALLAVLVLAPNVVGQLVATVS